VFLHYETNNKVSFRNQQKWNKKISSLHNRNKTPTEMQALLLLSISSQLTDEENIFFVEEQVYDPSLPGLPSM